METSRPAGTTKKPWYKSGKNWVIIGGVIVVLGIIGSLMPKDDTAPAGAPASTTQAPTSAAPKPVEKSTPAPTPTVDKAAYKKDWWAANGAHIAKFKTSLESLDGSSVGDFDFQNQCTNAIEWGGFGGELDTLTAPDAEIVGDDVYDAFLDATGGYKLVKDDCKDILDKQKLSKVADLERDMATAHAGFEKVMKAMKSN